MSSFSEARRTLQSLQKPERAMILQLFFKTAPGQYGAGDRFLGLTVPEIRLIAKQYPLLSLEDLKCFLASEWHEERLFALIVLVHQFERAKQEGDRKRVVDFYLSQTARINNWDLVDTSAHAILGVWLLDRPRTILTALARSPSLWERRIAVVATLAFIRKKESKDIFHLTKLLIADREDLIQKALGWMLREVGKHGGEAVLEMFLQEYASRLPRTTLRYAIERFEEGKRKKYLARGKIK